MANEARKSENAKSGTLTPGNSLTNSGTSMVSSNLAQVMAIGATEHYPIILDPLGAANGPEIAWITAHSAASTGATIVRGREGTSGVSHTSTTAWVHGPTVSDYIFKCTAATRPSTGGLPFVGQVIYETDTTLYLAYDGTTWQEIGRLGAWSTWTPAFTATGGSPTIGNGTVSARYHQQGRHVHAEFHIKLGSTTNFGTGILRCSLPVTARSGSANLQIGYGHAYDASAQQRFVCAVTLGSSTTVNLWHPTTGGPLTSTGTVPFAWDAASALDELAFVVDYEAAA